MQRSGFKVSGRIDTASSADRLLSEIHKRPRQPLLRRELLVELVFGGGFLIAATALALIGDQARDVDTSVTAIVFVGIVLAARVVFELGAAYTIPTQIAVVPALFVLSPAVVPLLVAGAMVVARSIDAVEGKRHPSRVLNVLGDSWFSLGSALVLTAGGSPTAVEAGAPLLLGALGAQLALDATMATLRARAHGGEWSRFPFMELAGVSAIDALLAPIGFALALAAGVEPLAVMLSWPVFLLLAVFARERDERLSSLLELSNAYTGTARVLGQVVDRDDSYTGLHVRGVSELAVAVAVAIGLDERRRRLVEFSALLHDIGKIAIPKEIINKPGPLTPAEWKLIKTHTVEGQRILDGIGGLMTDVGRVVRWSHERWDGDGYPDGLAGEEIPVESRIVFCCDAFNAMTTDRSYRTALTRGEAIAELRAHAGTQFDPDIVEVLVALVADGRYERGATVTALHAAGAATS